MRAVDDPRTLNKTIYINPPKNIVSQNDIGALWERESKIGKPLEKTYISEEELLKKIPGLYIRLTNFRWYRGNNASHILLGIWSEVESPGHKILATLGFTDEKAKLLRVKVDDDVNVNLGYCHVLICNLLIKRNVHFETLLVFIKFTSSVQTWLNC